MWCLSLDWFGAVAALPFAAATAGAGVVAAAPGVHPRESQREAQRAIAICYGKQFFP
jgi:hypothetical protein